MVQKFRGWVCGKVEGVRGLATTGVGKVVGAVAVAVAFVQVLAMETVMAADAVTIPDIGVDWADVGAKAGTALGLVVIGLIGVKIAMAIINAAVKMLGRMLG